MYLRFSLVSFRQAQFLAGLALGYCLTLGQLGLGSAQLGVSSAWGQLGLGSARLGVSSAWGQLGLGSARLYLVPS